MLPHRLFTKGLENKFYKVQRGIPINFCNKRQPQGLLQVAVYFPNSFLINFVSYMEIVLNFPMCLISR
ncbi:MAG TPA: hypothetical protein DIC60_09115 [Lachnospiraceae bacterium]|nr:hypothetical protein [Lachnospiraceae bacterium]